MKIIKSKEDFKNGISNLFKIDFMKEGYKL